MTKSLKTQSESNQDQKISPSIQQSLENKAHDDITKLGDIATALYDVQQAPLPSTTRRPVQNIINVPVSTTHKIITKVPSIARIRYSTTPFPSVFTTGKYLLKKKRPQAFDKINPSDPNSFAPLLNYDYYDEEMGILGRIPEHSKVLLHSNGVIECLDQGNFPHPVSCKKFISCAKMENGKVLGWEYTCPKNLSFDPIGGICNWSVGLGCSDQ